MSATDRLREYQSAVMNKFGALLADDFEKKTVIASIESVILEENGDIKEGFVFFLLPDGIEVVKGKESTVLQTKHQMAAVDMLVDYIPFRSISKLTKFIMNKNLQDKEKIYYIQIDLISGDKLTINPDVEFIPGSPYARSRQSDMNRFYEELRNKVDNTLQIVK
ncbi:hypothetical protein FZC83_05425 [Rossellomorea marisflavi]|uniref:Uncharacterized protein n=1 Tax=Rossellomorea marisflavi TaxID=189381 RepID=A0A5D4S4E2_9BACI|nr:hypothetical protein [Rossellomorea marisflavi]TYS57004.1 hypothetical protein FZC83_05425 [Rossellomorea marisflavi]